MEKVCLDLDQLKQLRQRAAEVGIEFLVTPFSVQDVGELAEVGLDGVKIASPDAVNLPLLDAVAELGWPVLISTGTCDIEELGPAAETARRSGGMLLQCVSAYPTPQEHASLGGIHVLRDRFAMPVGYSDHTAAIDTGGLAVAAGAVVLEKHLTHDPNADGPDHAASLAPADFKKYVAQACRASVMVGPAQKLCLEIERDVRTVSRQSLCIKRDLPAGHQLTSDDLTVKRPGLGLPAADWSSVIGRSLGKPVSANQLLRSEDLS